MGNYCSSGQNNKDKDDASDKSDDAHTYQLASKSKKSDNKEAPLADPEPTSDISNQNAPLASSGGSAINGNVCKTDVESSKPTTKALHNIQSSTTNDSTSSSPLAMNAPCDIPVIPSNQQVLPINLAPLYGKPSSQLRRTEKDRKIVLYVMAADNGHETEKSALYQTYRPLREYCFSRGFELQLVDTHKEADDYLDPKCWINQPLEARGGHHLDTVCVTEIARHYNLAYIIPVLFLGTTLGSPLLPLTIENTDFLSALCSAVDGSEEKRLLEKWYIVDAKAQPPCYRLRTQDIPIKSETQAELENLYRTLVDIFTKEVRDVYLTTVVEQEINNTVAIRQDLPKRCLWIHTGSLPLKTADLTQATSSIQNEMNRRLIYQQTVLKASLTEKNVIRIPPSVQVSSEQLAGTLRTLITAIIDQIVEEHATRQIPYCTFGVDRHLLSEIEIVNQHANILVQNCSNIGIMPKIKEYITAPATQPLIVFGAGGSGKSVFSAKLAESVHEWLPDCCFITRYANLTATSSDIVSFVGSVAEQVSYFTKNEPCMGPHTIEYYAEEIKNCIESTKHPLVILIDSLNEIQLLDNIEWLPTTLSDKVRIIITIQSNQLSIDDNDDATLASLKTKISKSNFIQLNELNDQQWAEVLNSCGTDFYAANVQLHLPEAWKTGKERIPLQAKLFWWLAWQGETDLADISLTSICDKVFQILENKFGDSITRLLISIIIASRDGIRETDAIDILGQSNLVTDSASKLWLKFCWILGRGPLLMLTNHVKIMDNTLKGFAKDRYAVDIHNAHVILYNHFVQQPDTIGDLDGRHQYMNIDKYIELPYHTYILCRSRNESNGDSTNTPPLNISSFESSSYLTELTWIFSKIKATKSVHYLLNDLHLLPAEQLAKCEHLVILKLFLENNIRPINYDVDQFYPLFKSFLMSAATSDENVANNSVCQQWLADLQHIPISYLENLSNDACASEEVEKGEGATAITTSPSTGYDYLVNLGGKGYFVASINTECEEICVWDVSTCQKVRILRGIPQPVSLCPVGEYGAAVLSGREIKVIDLNTGKFHVKLKGVMNQKMPFYGLHDERHLVCLSRNRMYVNLLNLESGDCITTFKAGEDRFLNSLLVSGDGRILVCGDETQKPFPLLVWHLQQRKLLYDLRIPHHDFLTSLSAITYEGSYVCVVAKELNEPTPNFIVVYDLQSGTLFKKWKPSCNTVSLSISQTNACVIAGLEDARILIWDLVTGNCKFTLVGHTAPVTLLKLDPTGTILLSADKEGRDRSVRVWELHSGKPLAVHTPPKRITTCEILPKGKYITLALVNEPNLVTLELKNRSVNNQQTDADVDNTNATVIYGDEENNHKIFQL